MRATVAAFGLTLTLTVVGCTPKKAPPAAAKPAETAEPRGPEQGKDQDTPPPQLQEQEACGEMILVAYEGAALAPPRIERDRESAQTRARDLLRRVREDPARFTELARRESDAPSSAARGGAFGTYAKDDWPELYATLRDPLFALAIQETAADIIETPHGSVILRRCPIDKAHVRHILIRYVGAKRAPETITRDRAAARDQAQALLQRLEAQENFADLARQYSEDPSAERGGDLGYLGRGLLSAPFETALFALPIGQHSQVVETDFGYHILERLPPPQNPNNKLASP